MTPIRLVVSSGHQQPDAAGLYLFDGSSVQPIDALPTSGLSIRGERLFRVAPYRQNDGTELLVYDARGICRYQRIDEIAGPHDALALEDGRLLCVSPHFNTVFSIGTDGAVASYWHADAPIDAWHVNCLAEHDGRLFATAFGRFESFRGWLPARDDAAGLLFDLDSGEPVVTGLSYPHSPRWIDGAWVICNSGDNAVVRVEPNGSRVSIPVGGFSRGMCAIGEHVFVGVSTPRATRHDAGKGWISVLDRKRWAEIERIPMPCSAMYDLIDVDETLLRSLQTGFRGGCERERYFGQLAMFEQVGAEPKRMWAVADPLPPQMCRVNIIATLPATLAVGDVARVRCRVENAGDAFLRLGRAVSGRGLLPLVRRRGQRGRCRNVAAHAFAARAGAARRRRADRRRRGTAAAGPLHAAPHAAARRRPVVRRRRSGERRHARDRRRRAVRAAVLIAAAFGDAGSGGGLFALDGSRAERIDRISTMGLSVDGEYLARAFRFRAQDAIGAEIVVYDAAGVQRYLRLDEAASVHDIVLEGENVAVVSPWHNAVRWFSPAGRIVREVQYPGPIDRWHLNCVTQRDGVWYATMFGPTGPFGGALPQREKAGRLVRLETGETVVGELTAPHTPRWLDGLWVVCNSGKGELIGAEDGSGRIVRRTACGDWTRGIAVDDAFLYVGASSRRASHDSLERADVVVLDRATWAVIDRIAIPAQELYDLAFVSGPLLDGVRRGFDVNPLRSAENRQYRILDELGVESPRNLWPNGEALPWSDFRCTIECTLPATGRRARSWICPCA